MWYGLIGKQTLIGLNVDVSTGVALRGDSRSHGAGLAKDLPAAGVLHVFARDHQDVAVDDWTNGLEDQEFVIPHAVVIDWGDGVFDVLDNGAEEAFAVLEGDYWFGGGGTFHLGSFVVGGGGCFR